MICKQCNNNVPNDSKFCSFCGCVVENVLVEKNIPSKVDEGYTYLELKKWKKAKEVFDFAIVSNDDKAKAYIGRLLAKLRLMDLESLSATNKKLTKFDDFKMAVKYADDNYKQQLQKCYSLVEEEIVKKKAKSKKRALITTLSCVLTGIFLVISYFVFIPLGRCLYYQNLLSNGEFKKAKESFSNSKWFEYDEKAKELFYEKGVSLAENKSYKSAEICFYNMFGYKDSNVYYNYCKAQNLLAENNLESYDYFMNCGNFLDSKNILETNKYFVMVKKLQGKWKEGERVPSESSYSEVEWDISKASVGGKISGYNENHATTIEKSQIIITGTSVDGWSTGNYRLTLINGQITIADGKGFQRPITLSDDGETMKFLQSIWKK